MPKDTGMEASGLLISIELILAKHILVVISIISNFIVDKPIRPDTEIKTPNEQLKIKGSSEVLIW